MKKNNLLWTIGSLMCFSYLIYASAAGVRDVNTCTVLCGTGSTNVKCTNQEANCGSSGEEDSGGIGFSASITGLNYYKEKVSWGQLGRIDRQDLGAITAPKEVTITLPAMNKKSIYTFIPSQGAQAGNTIEVLFVSFDTSGKAYPTNTPESVKDQISKLQNKNKFDAMVKIYRKFKDERQWMELGEVFLDYKTTTTKQPSVTMLIEPDGKAKTAAPITETAANGTQTTLEQATFDLAVLE